MVYLALVILLAAIVVAAHCRLLWRQDARLARIAGCRPPNQWHDARSWLAKEITYGAFQAMSPLEKEHLRQLVAYGRDGPPEFYRVLALGNKSHVLVIAANNGGYVYSALAGDEVPEPEQIADLAKEYNCPVFLFTRSDMLT